MSLSEPLTGAEARRAVLEGLPLLESLPDAVRELVAESFVEVSYAFGETVVRQGEPPDAYYVIVEGSARVLVEGDHGDEVSLNTLEPGDAFGEGALIEELPRTATVRASSALTVLRLDRGVFLALVRLHPGIAESFGVQSRARRIGDFLRLHSAFSALPREVIPALLEQLEPVSAAEGELLVRQGDEADAMFLVEDGRLAVTVEGENGDERTIRTLRTGDFFGELALYRGSRRTASVKALEPVSLLRLPATAFERLVAEQPAFRERIEERIALYEARELERPVAAAAGVAPALEEDPSLSAVEEHDDAVQAVDEREEAPEGRPRRFPVVRQIDQMDCGAACVAMLCRWYGHQISPTFIRQALGTSTEGTSLRGLRRGGEEIGIDFRAVKSSIDRLDVLPLPAILHWGGNHWVILHRLEGDRACVADPARGRRVYSRSELGDQWTGYAALPTPTPRLADAPHGRLDLSWLRPFVRPHGRTLAIALVLAMLAAGLQMLLPVFTQIVVDDAIDARDYQLVHLVMIGMLGVLGLAVGATILQRWLLARVAVRIDAGTVDFLTAKLLRLPLRYFETRRSIDIERRINGMRQIRRVLVQQGVGALTAATQLVAALVIMFVYSPPMALLFLATAPLYALLMRYSKRRLGPTFDALEEGYTRYHARQIDAIHGIETVKTMGAEAGMRRRMLAELRGLQDKLFRADFTLMVYDGLVRAATYFSFALFLWVGALLVLEGRLSVGELVSFNALVLLANAPILALLSLWDEVQLSSVLLGRLQDVFEYEPEQGEHADQLRPVDGLDGHVRLSRVGFHYASAPDRPVLQDVSLDVPPGTTVALLGRSGSGKSTLVKCLAGLLVPTEGSIIYDGVDMRELRFSELRRQLGFVLQEPYLFDDTIAANIAFGEQRPDQERLGWAAEVANAAEFIERLPLGYATRVGDSGLRLSGGQAQRVAIARAVYHRPPILVLDEATSALDSEAERAVKEAMDRLLVGRTAFVIAHRLSTVRDADLIAVLEQGRLVEVGSHEELMRRQGLYAYLHAQQLES